MTTVELRQTALAQRLGITLGELEPLADAGFGTRFQLQPGGFYHVYSTDEERQAFKRRVPDVPFVGQIRDAEGQAYNVYLAIDRGANQVVAMSGSA